MTYLSPDSDHSQAASPVKVHFAANTSVRPIQKQVIEFRLNAKNQRLRLDSGWDWVPIVPCVFFSANILGHNLLGKKKHTFSNGGFSEESGKVQTLPTVQGTSYSELHRVLPSSVRRTNLGRSSSTNYFNQSLRVESPQLFFDPLSCYLTPRMRPAVHQGSLC